VGGEFERLAGAGGDLVALGRAQCNLADAGALAACVREVRPAVIVNAAAYTAVDRAEREPALAEAVNGRAPGVLAEEAVRLGAYLVHFSTDYVFDGVKRAPYVESDEPHPLQAYGRSKLAGEIAVRAAGARHAILRTSWVYAHRGRNFVRAILDKARKDGRLRVVADQVGTPTWAQDVARLVAGLLRLRELPEGTFHAAAAGEASWCDFAREILRLAGSTAPVEAVTTAEYPTASRRPAYTVLDSGRLPRTTGLAPIGEWRSRLSAINDFEALRDLGRLAQHDGG
jgi:dTDP-4-dehydrorhamnose reductase